MENLKFNLGDPVTIKINEKAARVIGRVEYLSTPAQYLIEFVDGKGDRQIEWINPDDLNS